MNFFDISIIMANYTKFPMSIQKKFPWHFNTFDTISIASILKKFPLQLSWQQLAVQSLLI